MIPLLYASLSYFLFLCSQLLCLFVCCHVGDKRGGRAWHLAIYQHMGTEVKSAWSWARGQSADAQPAHGAFRNGAREHTPFSNVKKKEEEEVGGKTRIKAKHQLLKIAALPGIFLYLAAVSPPNNSKYTHIAQGHCKQSGERQTSMPGG